MRRYTILFLFIITSVVGIAQNKLERKWSIDCGIGYMVNNTDASIINIGFQKQMTNYLSIGATTGYYICGSGDVIPLLFDARAYFPIGHSNFSWGGIARVGYYTDDSCDDINAAIEILPGIKYKVNKRSELRLNMGSCTSSETLFNFQLGYTFYL